MSYAEYAAWTTELRAYRGENLPAEDGGHPWEIRYALEPVEAIPDCVEVNERESDVTAEIAMPGGTETETGLELLVTRPRVDP